MQRAVFAHIDARAAKNVVAFHVGNGGFRRPIEAAILKGMGVRAGIPDIVIIKAGRPFMLELKAPGGRLSEAQKSMRHKLWDAGVPVGEAHSLDEALTWLEKHGILKGRAQ